MILESSFSDGSEILKRHGYKNENISPEVRISEIPEGTKSLALIMDDPDAMAPAGKVWVHWVVWNISPLVKTIPENSIPQGAIQGITDFKKIGYGGPAPPDKEHTYIFKLYALDMTIEIPEGSSKEDLEKAMDGHIIEECKLTGTYTPD